MIAWPRAFEAACRALTAPGFHHDHVRQVIDQTPPFMNTTYSLALNGLELDASAASSIPGTVEAYVRLVEHVVSSYREDPRVRRYFGLPDEVERLVTLESGLPSAVRICRLDGYIDADSNDLKILENNADAPAGTLFTTRHARALDTLWERAAPATKSIAERFVETLLDDYQRWSGKPATRLHVFQPRGAANRESVELAQLIQATGLETRIVDPRELEYSEAGVFDGHGRVDFVWNKINTVAWNRLCADAPDLLALWRRAIRSRHACHVNPFAARYVAESKLTLSLLWEPWYRAALSTEQQGLAERLLPFATKLEPQKRVEWSGETHALERLVIERQNSLVLKEPYDIRGDGVTIGRGCSTDEWRARIARGFSEGWLVQAYVRPQTYPVVLSGSERSCRISNVSLDSFVFSGRWAGFGSKASTKDKVNLFQGGVKLRVSAEPDRRDGPEVVLSEDAYSLLNRVGRALAESRHGALRLLGPGTDEVRPYAEIHRDVSKVRGLLRALGAGPGDRIGIRAGNCYECIVLDLASLSLGCVSAHFPAKTDSPGDLFERYRLKLLFTHEANGEPRLTPVAVVTELVRNEQAPQTSGEWYQYAPDEPYTTKFTSGTTSQAKGIDATAVHFGHLAFHTGQEFGLSRDDSFLTLLPLSVYLQRFFFYLAILHDFPFAVGRLERAKNALAAVRPTLFVAPPAIYESLMSLHERTPSGDFRALWGGRIRALWTGSAPIPKAVLEYYLERQMPMFEGYGMTETGLIAKNYPGSSRPGSVGRLFPDTELRFAEDGEIQVRSRFHANRRYSFATEEQGRARFVGDGWIATGDVGWLDDDGFLYVTNRKDECIVLANGAKVAPAPLEARLRASGVFQQACVIGSGAARLAAVVVPCDPSSSAADMDAEILRVNRDFATDQRIAAYVVADEPFSPSNGMLTHTQKVIRRKVELTYAGRFDQG